MTIDDYLSEYETDAPIPVGTLVEYHGSIKWAHGPFEVVDVPGCQVTPGAIQLMPFEDHDTMHPGEILYNVRPKSVTPVVFP